MKGIWGNLFRAGGRAPLRFYRHGDGMSTPKGFWTLRDVFLTSKACPSIQNLDLGKSYGGLKVWSSRIRHGAACHYPNSAKL